MQVIFTRHGFRRGMRAAVPVLLGLSPFGFVTGLITAHHGLTLLDCVLMNAVVYAGASQILALADWTHPAPIVAAAFAAFVVNIRFTLMGPVLAPWLAGLRPPARYFNLALLVDHAWAISVTEIRRGGNDVALLAGMTIPIWAGWQVSCTAGFILARSLNLPPHHPIFFGALAAFLALLVPLWRGKSDIFPWIIAGGTAAIVAQFLPHSAWYILCGSLAGSLAGALMDRKPHG